MLAMALAVFSAFNFDFSKYDSAFYITIVVSGLLGVLISKRVQMTQMPELVGLFNGFGGGASGAIAYVELSGNSLPLSDVFRSNLLNGYRYIYFLRKPCCSNETTW